MGGRILPAVEAHVSSDTGESLSDQSVGGGRERGRRCGGRRRGIRSGIFARRQQYIYSHEKFQDGPEGYMREGVTTTGTKTNRGHGPEGYMWEGVTTERTEDMPRTSRGRYVVDWDIADELVGCLS